MLGSEAGVHKLRIYWVDINSNLFLNFTHQRFCWHFSSI